MREKAGSSHSRSVVTVAMGTYQQLLQFGAKEANLVSYPAGLYCLNKLPEFACLFSLVTLRRTTERHDFSFTAS